MIEVQLRLSRQVLCLVVPLVFGATAQAQQPAPNGMSLAEAAAKRFPQPVRVSDLIQHRVLQPTASQITLGWVRDVVRTTDGTIEVIVSYGGFLGFFTHPIAVPVDGMTLLGADMEIVDFTPQQLDRFPAYDKTGATRLPRDSTIRVGLARPSH